jgi:hypothetical protein
MMNLRFAANIFDELGDFEMADYIDGLLIKQAQISDVDQYNMDVDNYNRKFYQQQPVPKSNLKLTKPLSFPLGIQKATIPANVPVSSPVVAPTNVPISAPVQNKVPAKLPVNKKIPKGNFDKSINLMLGLEGGKSDEGSDRGGRTNYGITQFTYNAWNKKHNLPKRDVFKITPEIAKQIYKDEFWNVIKGAQLPKNVANAILSMALTDGPQDSIKFVQKMLGINPVSGIMGPITMTKIWEKSKKGDADFTRAILNKQIDRYQKDEQAATYGKGWTNRVEKVKDAIS